MKKGWLVLILVLLPSALLAQSAVSVTYANGPIEVLSASGRTFQPMAASVKLLQVGDQVRTGNGASIQLAMPDGSYMVVTQNSTVTIQDSWSSGLRNIMRVTLGKVWFYISRPGGGTNPIRVGTPTALIAVKGTTFEVTVDDALYTEVRCEEGMVGVEAIGHSDREVIIRPGFHTQVRPGEVPSTPIALNEAFPPREL